MSEKYESVLPFFKVKHCLTVHNTKIESFSLVVKGP